MIAEEQVRKYCSEDISRIENYEQAMNDETQVWDCHHRAEILPCGNFTIDTLKNFGLYHYRPSSELIFLTHSEHTRLHRINMSEDTRKKLIEALKEKPKSEEHRMKISESMKGKTKSEEHRRKISEALKEKLKSEEIRMKMSEARKAYWVKRKNADASFNVENGI